MRRIEEVMMTKAKMEKSMSELAEHIISTEAAENFNILCIRNILMDISITLATMCDRIRED